MVNPTPFEIDSQLQGDNARVTVAGELDLATVGALEEEVQALLSGNVARLIIDLGAVTFIDSSALRLFIVLNDRAANEAWQLGLIRPAGQALSIFQISGAEEHLPFIDDQTAR
jgi:anti-anti-sigma factor